MKTKFHIRSFVLGALLAAVVVVGIAAEKQSTQPTVWEYSIVTEELGHDTSTDYFWAQALTKKSAEGWDVVSSQRISIPGNDSSVQMILRRPKK